MTETAERDQGAIDVETAAACLSVLPENSDTYPMRCALREIRDYSDLRYRDWIRAMQQTNGRICLTWNAGQMLAPHYAAWFVDDTPGGLKVHLPGDNGRIVEGERAVDVVREVIEEADGAPSPVRREMTPFGEVFDS